MSDTTMTGATETGATGMRAPAGAGGFHAVAEVAEAASAVVRELRRHPAMLAVAFGTVAVGVATRRPGLIRGGGRMFAAQLVAAVGSTAQARLLGTGNGKRAATHPLANMAAGFAVDWAVRAVREGGKGSKRS